MRSRTPRYGIVAILTLLVSGTASAAKLEVADGDVKVYRGNGFERAVVGQNLKAGDRVMVGSQGEAKISYDDCIEIVQAGRVIVVHDVAACRAAADHGSGMFAGGAMAGIGGGATTGLVVGGLVAAGAGLGIYSATHKSKSGTSP